MGITLRGNYFPKIGGGIKGGKKFKAVQTGGPSGGLPDRRKTPGYTHWLRQFDWPVPWWVRRWNDCDGWRWLHGFGGKILPRIYCGRKLRKMCTVSHRQQTVVRNSGKDYAGTRDLAKTLNDWGNLCNVIKDTSLCGLGQTSPNPVLSTLENFAVEYHEHVIDKKCGQVIAKVYITMLSATNSVWGALPARCCPVHAIARDKRQKVHYIDPSICIRCGDCIEKCSLMLLPFSWNLRILV